MAVQAEGLMQAIREQVAHARLEKQKTNAANQHTEPSDNLLSEAGQDEHATKAATKVAEVFTTNRTYINEAKKIKETNPEAFDKVLSGEATITQAGEKKHADGMYQSRSTDFDRGGI